MTAPRARPGRSASTRHKTQETHEEPLRERLRGPSRWSSLLAWTDAAAEALSRRIRLPEAAKDVLFAGCLVLVVAWFGSGWFREGLPPIDFAGTVANLEALKSTVSQGTSVHWTDKWFCGAPTVALVSNLPWFAVYVPFTWWLDPVSAVKVGSLVLFMLAAVGAYAFLRVAVANRWASAIGAFVFALHPISISMTAPTGHANFPPLYAAIPFMFLAAWRYGLKGGVGRLLALVTLTAVMLWVDNERAAFVALCVVPLLVVLRLRAWREQSPNGTPAQATWAVVKMLAPFVLLLAWATAGIVVPLFAASGDLAFFTPEERADSISFFSLNNPLFLLDRAGAILRPAEFLPDDLSHNAIYLYLGVAPLVLLLLLPLSVRGTRHRFLAGYAAAMFAVSVVLAAGNRSLYDSASRSLGLMLKYSTRSLLANPTFLVATGLLAVAAMSTAIATWRYLAARRGRDAAAAVWLYAVPIVACALFVTTPFVWARKAIFIFGHMRSPYWFLTSVPALCLGMAAAAFVAGVMEKRLRRLTKAALVIGVAAALVFDFLPYRREFRYNYSRDISDEAPVASKMLSDARPDGRMLAADSYSPLMDMVIIQAGRQNGWGWLNWMSPRGLKEYILNNVYRNLRRDPERAALLAGVANVSHIVSCPADDHYESSGEVFRKRTLTKEFMAYSNPLLRPYVQAYAPEAAGWKPGEYAPPAMLEGVNCNVIERRPGRISVSTTADREHLLMAAEAYFPGWRASVDGHESKVSAFGGAFLFTNVPAGAHVVTFEYRPPRIYYAAYGTSAAYVLAALGYACTAVVRRRRGSGMAPSGGQRP